MVQAYHGTRAYFTEIDFSKLGANRGAEYGAGFYLTTDEGYASYYAEDATKGMVVTGEIDDSRLFVRDENLASPEIINKVKRAFQEIFSSNDIGGAFQQANFLTPPMIDGMTNKQLFDAVGVAVEKVTPSDGDNAHVDWAKNLSLVLGKAGFIGAHAEREDTIVVFKAEDLPDMTLHKISMFGRPEGMPENTSVGDVVISSVDRPASNHQAEVSFDR